MWNLRTNWLFLGNKQLALPSKISGATWGFFFFFLNEWEKVEWLRKRIGYNGILTTFWKNFLSTFNFGLFSERVYWLLFFCLPFDWDFFWIFFELFFESFFFKYFLFTTKKQQAVVNVTLRLRIFNLNIGSDSFIVCWAYYFTLW
jgi:hypothetical protein